MFEPGITPVLCLENINNSSRKCNAQYFSQGRIHIANKIPSRLLYAVSYGETYTRTQLCRNT